MAIESIMPIPPPLASKRRAALYSRRTFLKALAGITATGAATYAYGSFFESHRLVTEHVTINIPGLAAAREGTRIVQLSDLHLGRTSLKHIARALETAQSLKPDFLVFTGDFIDETPKELPGFCKMFEPFSRHIESLGCTGNHDFRRGHINTVCEQLSNAGIRLLRNASHQPRPGAGELSFTGFEDYWYTFDARAMNTAPPDASNIVLSHNPDSYDDIASRRWHLMLSGHTHGGQVCIPGIGALILPVVHKDRVSGSYHLDPTQPHRTLYVARGIGHLLRIRLFCPPEVTCFTLRRVDSVA